jgi:hypothetical protein
VGREEGYHGHAKRRRYAVIWAQYLGSCFP